MDTRVLAVARTMQELVQARREISLAELSRAVNLSTSRLRHLFKEEAGVSPAQYVRLVRMRQARQLIESTFLTVKEVMSGVGVNDESHFTRDFKRYWGDSPTRYRERWRGAADGDPLIDDMPQAKRKA
jgi:transcriptional regulator GlxA family with amidase domain